MPPNTMLGRHGKGVGVGDAVVVIAISETWAANRCFEEHPSRRYVASDHPIFLTQISACPPQCISPYLQSPAARFCDAPNLRIFSISGSYLGTGIAMSTCDVR